MGLHWFAFALLDLHPFSLLHTHTRSGVHCEGPFISSEKRGAHPQAHINPLPSPDSLMRRYGSLDNVSVVTMAPELRGAMETIRWLCGEKNVTVSLGHSMATLSDAEEAVKNGASLITHLFNAMLPVGASLSPVRIACVSITVWRMARSSI